MPHQLQLSLSIWTEMMKKFSRKWELYVRHSAYVVQHKIIFQSYAVKSNVDTPLTQIISSYLIKML